MRSVYLSAPLKCCPTRLPASRRRSRKVRFSFALVSACSVSGAGTGLAVVLVEGCLAVGAAVSRGFPSVRSVVCGPVGSSVAASGGAGVNVAVAAGKRVFGFDCAPDATFSFRRVRSALIRCSAVESATRPGSPRVMRLRIRFRDRAFSVLLFEGVVAVLEVSFVSVFRSGGGRSLPFVPLRVRPSALASPPPFPSPLLSP